MGRPNEILEYKRRLNTLSSSFSSLLSSFILSVRCGGTPAVAAAMDGGIVAVEAVAAFVVAYW